MSVPRRRITPRDLWTLARVGVPIPSSDGRLAVVGATIYDIEANHGTERLWLLPERLPLTPADVSCGHPALRADGRRLAFLRKPQGQEIDQLWVMPMDGSGEPRQLTDFPLGCTDPRWFPDGRRLAVLAPVYRAAPTLAGTRALAEGRRGEPRPRVTEDRVYRFWDRWLTDGEVHHVFAIDADTGVALDLTPESTRWFDLFDPDGQYDISPDGTEIAFSANATPPPHAELRASVFAVPAAGGPVRALTPDHPGDAVRPRYAPDGRHLVFGGKLDHGNIADRVRLFRLDLGTGRAENVTEAWDRSASAWSFVDARTLVVEAEERGRGALFLVDLDDPRPRLLSAEGTVRGAHAAGGFIYAQHQSMTSPPDAVRVPLAGGAIEHIGGFNLDLLAQLDLAQPEEIDVDGVQTFLLRGAHAPRPGPLVQIVHGGPFGAHLDSWHWRWNQQVLAADHACAFVNFHGSSGFGQAFAEAVMGDWGGQAADDILRATDHLVRRGVADPARIAIAGGSFGGYMTCWLASQTDRFVCAVAHSAVYNLTTLLASDVTHDIERDLGVAPWDLAINRHNPAVYAPAWKTPTLVTHGEKDYRVPVEHAYELYGMLKARGVPARLVCYPEESHWIGKPQSSLHWYSEVLNWLARYLP
jgi:dipeptidyl aminopeptidase/acylaminoacyl peptidase